MSGQGSLRQIIVAWKSSDIINCELHTTKSYRKLPPSLFFFFFFLNNRNLTNGLWISTHTPLLFSSCLIRFKATSLKRCKTKWNKRHSAVSVQFGRRDSEKPTREAAKPCSQQTAILNLSCHLGELCRPGAIITICEMLPAHPRKWKVIVTIWQLSEDFFFSARFSPCVQAMWRIIFWSVLRWMAALGRIWRCHQNGQDG